MKNLKFGLGVCMLIALPLLNMSCSKSKACQVVADCCSYINSSSSLKKIAGQRCEYAQFGIKKDNEKTCLTSISRINGEIGNARVTGTNVVIPSACKL